MYDISRNVLNISVILNVSEIFMDIAFICVATVMQYFLLTRLLSASQNVSPCVTLITDYVFT